MLLAGVLAPAVRALEPRDVFLIVNRNTERSAEVAEHYLRARGVPRENVVVLDLPIGEDMTRDEYESRLLKPLRAALRPRWEQVKVLVACYGVPLRVGPVAQSENEAAEAVDVRKRLDELRVTAAARRQAVKSIEDDVAKLNLDVMKPRLEEMRKELTHLEREIREGEEQDRRLRHAESEAAVDSELMQIWWDAYPKHRWITNMNYWRLSDRVRRGFPPVVMTARLDGPTVTVVKRMIDDAVWAERHGLHGRVYFDARGLPFDPKADQFGVGYGGYDESFREAARLLHDEAGLKVQLDNQDALFDPYSCTDCDLYCGWYSVKKFVPSCKFNRGAVAWHLASFEAVSLRNPQTQWCGNLLADGACATLGPVAEPYTIAFPRPAEFFGFLVTGEYTLVECYAKTVMLSSWMMTLVGDPLYNPYKSDPRLKPAQIRPSPKGAQFEWDK